MTPEQLKASILQRAMEGKLVPQDPSDEPASELLKRIKAEKEKLIAEGKIKRDKKETEIFRGDDGKPYEKLADGTIQEIDVPYEIPDSWEWVRLKTVTQINMKNSYLEGKTSFIPMALIDGGYSNVHTFEIKEWDEIKKGYTHFQEGDILLAKITPCFQNRKSAIATNLKGGMGAGTTEIYSIRVSQNISPLFILYILKSNDFISQGMKNFTGTAGQQRIPRTFLENYYVPIPPLSEQKRIVEQIELALAKVDEYAESYNRLQELDKTFPDKLKKSILQCAMQGKLVEQDPNDEPVEVLLEKIRVEKQRLFEEGKLKKKDLEETIITQGDDNSYYREVPKGWKLQQLQNLVQLHNGDKVANKKLMYLDAKTLRGLKPVEYREKGNQVYTGDCVILVDGENSGELFDISANGYMGSTFKKVYYFSSDSQIYINWFILSRKELLRNSKTGSAIPHLNKNLFKELVIGLPPIPEQHRISNKISQVFSKINNLI